MSDAPAPAAALAPTAATPLLELPFEPAIEGLGPDYWDVVEAAAFPRTQLCFGTCERLLFLRQPEKLERRLRHGLAHDHPHLAAGFTTAGSTPTT